MRIAMFSWRSPSHPLAGGAEFFTDRLLRELSQLGHQAVWITATSRSNKEQDSSCPYQSVELGGRYSVYSKAREWARQNHSGFDVLVDQVNTVPFQLSRLGVSTPVAGLFYQTAEDVWSSNTALPVALAGRFLLEPRWLRGFKGVPVAALSDSTKQALRRFGIDDVTVIGSALPTDCSCSFQTQRPRTHNLLSISRIVGYKQVDHAIKAVEIARKQLPMLTLTVVGDGPELRNLARRYSSWVRFLGHVSPQRKCELFEESDAHIVCSKREGWALTVTEAAVHGVPTIGYANPGLVDSITSANGYLTPPSPTALAAWIAQFYEATVECSTPPPDGGASTWRLIAEDFLSVIARSSAVVSPQRTA